MAGLPSAPLPEPLRLPRGSVRGLIALFLLGTFAALVTQTGTVSQVLINAAVVVIAFYYGSGALRAQSPLAAAAAPGPVLHPHRFVRALLFLGFAGLAAWFLRAGLTATAIPAPLLQVWEVLGGYSAGRIASWVFHRRAHETTRHRVLAIVFRDVSAAAALGLTGYICYALLTNQAGALAGRAEEILSIVVTYYFGSRVIAH